MNREDLLKHHVHICNAGLELMKKKNHDYAGNSGETPFANFERCEAMGICSTEAGFLVRLTDMLSRLSTFASAGKLTVDNESYEDAIIDIINYCVLFSAYNKGKTQKQ